jgi:hypothetical protein
MKTWASKDPDEIRDRGFNWTPRNIGSAKITNIVAQVTSGDVVITNSAIKPVLGARADQGTVHRFSGGTGGTTSTILLTATLDDGQILQQTILLPIRNI